MISRNFPTFQYFHIQNHRVKVLDLDCRSCKNTSFSGLTTLEELYIGYQINQRTRERINTTLNIDSRSLSNLPMNLRYLELSRATIISSVIESNGEKGSVKLLLSLEMLKCDPSGLSFLDASPLDNVKELTLRISKFIDESDPCWQYLPANLKKLSITGHISKHEFDAYQPTQGHHDDEADHTDHKPFKVSWIYDPRESQMLCLYANFGSNYRQ
ncbi:unnamed protein product [Ambrosiozyma monospora]|uniref:Unnamed protein product n=1 Tax=Ambrosiozyma monospora TaxID=43982 RepID=A0ACB5SYK4_AMBMO|nr:unnamed protein product [Ambrosiozyma monospora]